MEVIVGMNEVRYRDIEVVVCKSGYFLRLKGQLGQPREWKTLEYTEDDLARWGARYAEPLLLHEDRHTGSGFRPTG